MPDSLLSDGPSLAAARVIAYAGNLIRGEGYERVPVAGRPGVSLSLAICTKARCEIMRPQLPIYHTELCYLAHARLAGYLYLTGRVSLARGELAEVCGEWERRAQVTGAEAIAVADGAVAALGLDVDRLECGYVVEGSTNEARMRDLQHHLEACDGAPR